MHKVNSRIPYPIRKVLILWKKLRFMILRDGEARARFLRKGNYLASIGENVLFYSRIFPADSELLKIGNNVAIATNVRFLGHDRIDVVLSGMFHKKYTRVYDCIEVGNNVFIGSDVTVCPGVKIGDNTIIGAGAVVTRDLPPGNVWGGVPARQIGLFEDVVNRRKDTLRTEDDPEKLWERFNKSHKAWNE